MQAALAGKACGMHLANMTAYGVLNLAILYFFLPETAHTPLRWQVERDNRNALDGGSRKSVIYIFNPFRCVALLRYPNLLVTSIVSSLILATSYALSVPLALTMAPRYNITDGVILGVYFVAESSTNGSSCFYLLAWGTLSVPISRDIMPTGQSVPGTRSEGSAYRKTVSVPALSPRYSSCPRHCCLQVGRYNTTWRIFLFP